MRNHFYFVVVQLHTLEEDHTDSSIVPRFVCFFVLYCCREINNIWILNTEDVCGIFGL